MDTFENSLKHAREKVVSDRTPTPVPLNTEEDIRRALRVVIDTLGALNQRLLKLEAKK